MTRGDALWERITEGSYLVRLWIEADVGLDVVAHAAADAASQSPHVTVLGVDPAGDEIMVRYRILAYGIVELLGVMHRTFEAAAAGSSARVGICTRVSITHETPAQASRQLSLYEDLTERRNAGKGLRRSGSSN